MAAYHIEEIELLLHLILAKYNQPMNREGFARLAELLNTDIPDNSQNPITQKYLDERIYRQIAKAKTDNLPNLSLNQSYISVLTSALGFRNYLDYQKVFERMAGMFAMTDFCADKEGKVRIVHGKVTRQSIAKLISQSVNPEQSLPVRYIHFEKKEQLTPVLLEIQEDSSLTIFIVGKHDSEATVTSIKELLHKTHQTVLLDRRGRDDNSEQERVFSGHEFRLFIQMFLIRKQTDETAPATQEGPHPVHIQNSASTFLGNIGSITAEYLSSRDMHINIVNKHKK